MKHDLLGYRFRRVWPPGGKVFLPLGAHALWWAVISRGRWAKVGQSVNRFICEEQWTTHFKHELERKGQGHLRSFVFVVLEQDEVLTHPTGSVNIYVFKRKRDLVAASRLAEIAQIMES